MQGHDGDRGALEIADLADRYWDRLFHIAYMMLHDRAAAEDVVQEALTRAIERFTDFRGGSEVFTWACSIVINQCRLRMRGNRIHAAALEPRFAGLARPARRSPVSSAAMHEAYQRAAVAVAGLPGALREAFILHYVEELSYDVVAGICGISEGAARLRALRARQALKRDLANLLDAGVRRRLEHEPAEAG